MKYIILMFSMINCVQYNLYSQSSNKLSKKDQNFINNVIKAHNEKPIKITKRKDNHIIIEFKNIMVVLLPNGYIGETWIYENQDWISLGSELEAY